MDHPLSEGSASPGPERYSFHQTRSPPVFSKLNNGSGATTTTTVVERHTRSSGFSGFSEDMPSHFGRASLSSQGSDLAPETPATFAPSQPDSPESPVADSVFVPAAAPAKAAPPAAGTQTRNSTGGSPKQPRPQRTPSPSTASGTRSRTPSPTPSSGPPAPRQPAPRSPSPQRAIYKSPPKAKVQPAPTPPPAQAPRRASTPPADHPQGEASPQHPQQDTSALCRQLESLQGEVKRLRGDKSGLMKMLNDAKKGLESAVKKGDELSRANEKLSKSNEQLRGDLAGTEGMAAENERLREKLKGHSAELARNDSEHEERAKCLREEIDELRLEVERQKIATQEESALKDDALQELYRTREEVLTGPEVHKEIHVEREGMKARTDLLRKIHENFKVADNAIKHLRTARHTDTFHKLRRSTSERYGKDLLGHLEAALEMLQGLQASSTAIIRTYFTSTEKLHCGMSSELFRPLHPHDHPQKLEEKITTTVVKTLCPPSPMSPLEDCIGHCDMETPEPPLTSPARSRSRSRSPGHSTTASASSNASRARSPHTNHRLFAAAKYSPSARHTRASPRAPGAAESSPGKMPLDRHSPTAVVAQALGLSPAAPAYSPPRTKASAGGARRGEAERDRLPANPYPGMTV